MSILAVTQQLTRLAVSILPLHWLFQTRQLFGKILTSLNVTAYLSLIVTTYVFSNKQKINADRVSVQKRILKSEILE